ncbi:UNVERIFIED_CONTAM: hypothetical protein Slati_0903900 [Sesamum latifolium]|uniref:DUF4283 domain-containing protein n=1 Tax=Sesamum latifolium TaxID=2727402 RepID=A0AAW2XNK4_9LAMI
MLGKQRVGRVQHLIYYFLLAYLGMDRLGTFLKLTKNEALGLNLTTGDGTEIGEVFVLVGRLLTPRAVRYNVLKTTLQSLIRPVKGMEIRRLAEDRFLLRFNYRVDVDRALGGCPWTFDKNLIILSRVNDEQNPLEVNLYWCPFHVHTHGLPLRMMTKEVVELIGNRLGVYIESDHEQSSFLLGSSV